MSPLLPIILAQSFGVGGYGPHLLIGLAASVVGGVVTIGGQWITGRNTRGGATDAWIRDQFETFVAAQETENKALKESLERLEMQVVEQKALNQTQAADLVRCHGTCDRLRRERDNCRDSHRRLYGINEQLLARLGPTPGVAGTTTTSSTTSTTTTTPDGPQEIQR